jgi:hypothetical protein
MAPGYVESVLNDVSHAEALRLISDCEERQVPILGLEWFRREGDTVTPLGVADFSAADPGTSWAKHGSFSRPQLRRTGAIEQEPLIGTAERPQQA